ncbi:polyprenyl synthetase family protein [Luminiphilus sp.]|nr:polyprenyl synthetase family protein [Luminiphilus sp.]MDA9711271.1 polyprenyl synthetase family protein [Luminiphilus sp.]
MAENIKDSVTAEFARVDEVIVELLQSDVEMVENIGHYVINAGGKRMRPLLVLLSAKALGSIEDAHIRFAAVVEFIHTATLLHDDVVDLSTLRRGMPTANAAFGNAPSVLVGDFIYTRAFQLMVGLANMPLLAHMAETTNTIAAGEVMQLVHAGDPNTQAEQYQEIIRRKTAALFAAACRGAALLRNAEAEKSNALHDYGMHLGIAFQLADDLLDYTGNPGETGKNVGDDLNEGKITLPLLHALKVGDAEERRFVAETLRNKDGNAFADIMSIVQRTGGIDATREAATSHQQHAIDALNTLGNNDAVLALHTMASQVVERRS